MKLGLGTVQFGLPYGVAHAGGATPQHEIDRIVEAAAAHGIDCLDTAPAYGDSEARLGQALAHGGAFRIVTKTPVFDADEISRSHAALLRATFLKSLENLRQDKLYGLLVHHADEVSKPGGEQLVEAMQALQHEGLVEKLGVSVSGARQIDAVLGVFQPDIVQLPLNVLDQRLLGSGHVKALKRRGVEIHARSIFLQGLLLMPPGAAPLFFSPLRGLLEQYAKVLESRGMTRMHGALAFVRQVEALDYAIFGVQSAGELEEILEAIGPSTHDRIDFGRFAVSDENMILPQHWKLTANP